MKYVYLSKCVESSGGQVFSLTESCAVAATALYFMIKSLFVVSSVVEWLKHRTDNQHGLGSKPTCAILLCPWE